MRDYAEQVKTLRRCLIYSCSGCYLRENQSCKAQLRQDAADAIEELLAEVKHWELEAAANETDRNYLIDENRKLVNSLMNFRVAMWISVEEQGLPETYFKGVRSQEEFLVVVAKRWSPRDEWEYHTDTALNWGTYIDDFWDTQNDWHEGEEVHVVAYMPFPDPLRIPPKEVE